jgi:nucleoside-diphosphate-sugar epimerase
METILITGANGEVGHRLISELSKTSKIIAFDINELDETLKPRVSKFIKGSITDKVIIDQVVNENNIDTIFHLAAILSTSGEKDPFKAHEVNVQGTINIIESAVKHDRKIKFIFPSSIAVYGMPSSEIKKISKKVRGDEYLKPITMYGINKLYCENLGSYFSDYYQQLADNPKRNIDFRCVRFPGLISAETIPSGGTSDYASEMIHFAAQNKAYQCFVREDSIIPFMAMPDAIKSLIELTNAPREKLTQNVYNIRGFSVSAKEIEEMVRKSFPNCQISYKVNEVRQKIIDSWPEDVDDTPAQKDWDWKPDYDFKKAFEDYLIPSIKRHYGLNSSS